MRALASVVWLMAFSLSTFVSGILPVHAPRAVEHLAADSATASRLLPNQANPSIYPGYAPGYGPYPSCKIDPKQLPPGWPATSSTSALV